MPRRKPSVLKDLDKYVSVVELAHSAGLATESPVAWFRRRKMRVYKHGSRNYVTMADAEAYLDAWGLERVARRPKGWKTVKAVLDRGVGDITLRKAVRSGRVRAVVVGKTIYIDPGDAERFVLEYGSLKPLPGWVLVPALRDELGISKEALNQWIRRNKVPVRRFIHPTCNRPTPYIGQADADRYRALVAEGSVKHKGYIYSHGVHSRNLVLRAVAEAGPAGLTAKEASALTGVGFGTCRDTLRKLHNAGELERTGPGTWKEHFRFSLPLQRAA